MSEIPPTEERRRAELLSQVGETRTSIWQEYLHFLRSTRKWWLLPLIFALLLFGVLLVLASTGAAPFVYTLF